MSNNNRTCEKGHRYTKSSDCPTCPVCEALKKPTEGFQSLLAAPARRALENAGIHTLAQLASYTESEIAHLHGMGPNAMGKLKKIMSDNKIDFKIQ